MRIAASRRKSRATCDGAVVGQTTSSGVSRSKAGLARNDSVRPLDSFCGGRPAKQAVFAFTSERRASFTTAEFARMVERAHAPKRSWGSKPTRMCSGTRATMRWHDSRGRLCRRTLSSNLPRFCDGTPGNPPPPGNNRRDAPQLSYVLAGSEHESI